MVKVKICGLTNINDALKACELGADLVGFVFVEGTPRNMDPVPVKDIIGGLQPYIDKDILPVGLFLDEKIEKVAEIISLTGIRAVQLHGAETPEYCYKLKRIVPGIKILKVFKVSSGNGDIYCGGYLPREYKDADYYLFDTFHPDKEGGTGDVFDWNTLLAKKGEMEKPFFVAGGLVPGNVAQAVTRIKPYGVDVSSGVEINVGKKDEKLLKEFISNAKKTGVT